MPSTIAGWIWAAAIGLGLFGWVWAGVKRKSRSMVVAAVLTIAGWIWAGGAEGTLPEFIVFLGSSAGLAATSSVLLQVLKLYAPSLQNNAARAASAVAAFVVCLGANTMIPYIPNIPEPFLQYWWIVVWLVGQIWFIYGKEAFYLYKSYGSP